jgi:sulfite exporter TauE/SafE
VNIYQAIALVSAALAVLASSWDAYRLRHEQRYSLIVMAITAGGPILSLWLYLTITGLSLRQIVSLALFAAGAAAGLYAANRAKLSEVGSSGQIHMVGASWLPLPAALAVAALQISGAVGILAGQVFSLAALEAAVAFGVFSAAVLVYRRSNFGKAGQGSAAAGEPGTP